jgi:hypothetical protein
MTLSRQGVGTLPDLIDTTVALPEYGVTNSEYRSTGE